MITTQEISESSLRSNEVRCGGNHQPLICPHFPSFFPRVSHLLLLLQQQFRPHMQPNKKMEAPPSDGEETKCNRSRLCVSPLHSNPGTDEAATDFSRLSFCFSSSFSTVCVLYYHNRNWTVMTCSIYSYKPITNNSAVQR
jgi:hypothetical protein